MLHSVLSALLFSLLIITPGQADAASFDCGKASTLVEKAVCADPELSALDEEMAGRYRIISAMTPDRDAKKEQLYWLGLRNACKDKNCIQSVLQERTSGQRILFQELVMRRVVKDYDPYNGKSGQTAPGTTENNDKLFADDFLIAGFDKFRLLTDKGDLFWAPWMKASKVEELTRNANGLKGRKARITFSKSVGKSGMTECQVQTISDIGDKGLGLAAKDRVEDNLEEGLIALQYFQEYTTKKNKAAAEKSRQDALGWFTLAAAQGSAVAVSAIKTLDPKSPMSYEKAEKIINDKAMQIRFLLPKDAKEPVAPYIDKDACPGEKCSYGDWKILQPVQLVKAPGSKETVHTFKAGEKVVSLTGEVHATPGVLVLAEPAHNRQYAVGDVFYVVGYEGEGCFKALFLGKPTSVCPLDICHESLQSPICMGWASPFDYVWWAQFRLPGGGTGWAVVDDRIDIAPWMNP